MGVDAWTAVSVDAWAAAVGVDAWAARGIESDTGRRCPQQVVSMIDLCVHLDEYPFEYSSHSRMRCKKKKEKKAGTPQVILMMRRRRGLLNISGTYS